MPFYIDKDNKGSYIRWGTKGKKYYFIEGNSHSFLIAQQKAYKQMKAIEISRQQRY